MGCTRSPFSGGLQCCAFCTGPVNPDVIVRGVRAQCKRVLKIDAECVVTSMDCEANFGRLIDGISQTVITPSR